MGAGYRPLVDTPDARGYVLGPLALRAYAALFFGGGVGMKPTGKHTT